MRDNDYWDHRFDYRINQISEERTITIGERQVTLKRTENANEYVISYDDEDVLLDKDFILGKSEEYLTIHQMRYIKNADLENFKINSDYYLYVYDDNIFIIDDGWRRYNYIYAHQFCDEIPRAFYRFDLDTQEIQYAGYYFYSFDKTTEGKLHLKVQKAEE